MPRTIADITLRAVNGRYVCAEGGGGRELIANRNAIGPWETFQLVRMSEGEGPLLGGEQVAFRAFHSRYVCAENAGERPLVADRNAIGPWETFTIFRADGSGGEIASGQLVAIRAVNGRYVCAEDAGARPLIANRNAIGPWETFAIQLTPAAAVTPAPTDVDLCVDTPEPVGDVPPRGSTSILVIQEDGTVVGQSQGPLAGTPELMWNPGQVLRIRMTGGTAEVRSKVRRYATEWTQYANIRFEFVDDSQPAEIKISFDRSGRSWSKIGRRALLIPFNFSTMNFSFNDSTPDWEIRATTLHEFGHALGLIHEHQSPAAGIPWNREAVYAHFATTQTPPWSREEVDRNVFDRYSVSSTNYSTFDPQSIMQYWIPAALTLDGVERAGGSTLSPTDIEYIRRWYPFPGDASGQLRTGDDCDEIDFNVEYGVVSPDNVQFHLRPGSGITWWKSISVPIGGSGYHELQMQDGNSAEAEFARADLDNARPIRFSKAKLFGVHTLLGYRWDVLPALPGGSRVTLSWNRDRC